MSVYRKVKRLERCNELSDTPWLIRMIPADCSVSFRQSDMIPADCSASFRQSDMIPADCSALCALTILETFEIRPDRAAFSCFAGPKVMYFHASMKYMIFVPWYHYIYKNEKNMDSCISCTPPCINCIYCRSSPSISPVASSGRESKR